MKDNGYAWVICLASFLIYFICDGIGTAFGVMAPYLKSRLNCTTGMATLIGSMHLGLAFVLAPANVFLNSRLGYQIVANIGATVFTLGT